MPDLTLETPNSKFARYVKDAELRSPTKNATWPSPLKILWSRMRHWTGGPSTWNPTQGLVGFASSTYSGQSTIHTLCLFQGTTLRWLGLITFSVANLHFCKGVRTATSQHITWNIRACDALTFWGEGESSKVWPILAWSMIVARTSTLSNCSSTGGIEITRVLYFFLFFGVPWLVILIFMNLDENEPFHDPSLIARLCEFFVSNLLNLQIDWLTLQVVIIIPHLRSFLSVLFAASLLIWLHFTTYTTHDRSLVRIFGTVHDL